MGEVSARRPKLMQLVLPRRGLDQLLRGWSSDGQVFSALAAVDESGTDVVWSERDIERRAMRVLLEKIEPELSRLPPDAKKWSEHLPVTTESSREVSPRPRAPTDWAGTVRRYGWPPRAFVGRPRSRVHDQTTVRVLTWTAQHLQKMVRDVDPVARQLVDRVRPVVVAMVQAVDLGENEARLKRPDRADIHSLAGSGAPWATLAVVAEALVRAEGDMDFLAYELIEPIPELQWRLFHLSVLGETLNALRELGGRVRWSAPLSASSSSGPQFRVLLDGRVWDLWFEASSATRHYGLGSPYRSATAGVQVQQQSIGADIMLCLPGERALMFECKWSADGTYVGRDGYHQASSYLIEASTGLATDIWSYVIGPSEVVPASSKTVLNWLTGVAVVGVASIEDVAELVLTVVKGSTAPSTAPTAPSA